MHAESALTSRCEHWPVRFFRVKHLPTEQPFAPTTSRTKTTIRKEYYTSSGALVRKATGISGIIKFRRRLQAETPKFCCPHVTSHPRQKNRSQRIPGRTPCLHIVLSLPPLVPHLRLSKTMHQCRPLLARMTIEYPTDNQPYG